MTYAFFLTDSTGAVVDCLVAGNDTAGVIAGTAPTNGAPASESLAGCATGSIQSAY